MAGVYGRRFLNARNNVSKETMVNVVMISPNMTVLIAYPGPGIVAPNETLRPSEPQASSGKQPSTAPVSCAAT